MIEGLDHVVLACPDLDDGVAAYSTLLGAEPVWRSEAEGLATATFAFENTALELLAPRGNGAAAERLRQITTSGAKLTSLAFRTRDIGETRRTLDRRGLAPGDISAGQSVDVATGKLRSWKRFRVPDDRLAAIKTFLLELADAPLQSGPVIPGGVSALDHLVIDTPNPERAVANYGARLGLRFALDRTAPEWKTRFVFFRVGELTLEIIHRLDAAHDPKGDDVFGGVTWAVFDIEAARERLVAAGRTVSAIRTGRKPGSRVFTVRDGTLGVPTLFIDHAPR